MKKGGKEAEEVSEMEVPLVRKWRRLMRAGDNVPTRENVLAEEMTSTRDVADQKEGDTGGGEGLMAPERSRLGDGGDGRQALPLVVVPFEPVAGEVPAARKKQATKARRLQALTVAQDMLCATPGRLGRIEGERGEVGAVGAAWSEEVGEGARPCMLNWPRVTMQSNLSTTDEKQKWLLNCLP